MKQEVQKQYPQLNEQQIEETTRKYVNPPARIGDAYVPPHLTGGAVDVTLFSVETKQEVEMGSRFDDCTEKAHALFYEQISPSDPPDFLLYRDRRNTLREAMTQAGFAPYEYEWWHFDYGDIMWSRATGKPAFLSPLFGDQEGPVP